MYDLNW